MPITVASILAEVARQESVVDYQPASSLLGQAMDEMARENDDSVVDILTYITAPWGLNETPYPQQRFILKLIFGLPLDDIEEDIEIYDEFREKLIRKCSEVEFLDFLHVDDRCNFDSRQHAARLGTKINKLVLRMGRRGTKTTICQWMAAYNLYCLIKRRWPQGYYHIRKDQPISITLVATGKDQAITLLAPARSAIKRVPFLRQYVETDSKQKITLNTQYNREHGLGPESGLFVQAAPCSAKSIRGDANLMVLLEEYGQFFWELAGSNKSDIAIYRAVAPSVSGFVDPHTGKPEGMLLIISTPLSKESHMFTIEDDIRKGREENGLFLHLPSWWMNPLIQPSELRSHYNSDRVGFDQEYGAIYLDQTESAFKRADMEACRQSPRGAALAIQRGEVCFMGLDLGLKNDGTTITIEAVNQNGECRTVHHEQHRVGLPPYDDPTITELDIKEMAARVDFLWNYYSCMGGIGDQWNAYGVRSYLTSRAYEMLAFIDFNQTNNDRVARHCIQMIEQKRVTFYYDDEAWENDESILREFVRLQRRQSSGDPPKIKIEAMTSRGMHDDQYSSVSRALWAAKIGAEDNTLPSHGTRSPAHERIAKSLRQRVDQLRRQSAQTVRKSPDSPLRGRGRGW